MLIDYLSDHLEFVDTLAQWHHKEWAYLRPGDTLEARITRLRADCGREEIPTVFVAVSGGTLLGSAMLIDHDMDTRMDLSPWLAGVFVAPDHRRQGIGSALVRRVVECATTLGVTRLYLYTPSAERLYSKLGWSALERTIYQGVNVMVMSYDMPSNTAPGTKSDPRRQASDL